MQGEEAKDVSSQLLDLDLQRQREEAEADDGRRTVASPLVHRIF